MTRSVDHEGDGEEGDDADGELFVRAWEEEEETRDGSDAAEILVKTVDISDLCEMYTEEEAAAFLSEGSGEWREGGSSSGRKFIGMGFVKKELTKKRSRGRDRDGDYVIARVPWGKEGTTDDPRFIIRKRGFIHKDENLPFMAWPTVGYIDGFNATQQQTKRPIGGTYFDLGSTTLALQRKRGHATATT